MYVWNVDSKNILHSSIWDYIKSEHDINCSYEKK